MANAQRAAVTLLQLNNFIAGLVTSPATQNVWVTAELSDVAVRGGHCYMELLQKNASTGATEAKARGAIWANRFQSIRRKFFEATGQEFASGIKVMVCCSVSMHAVYGLSLVITDVDPSYTMGDLVRRRNEMLARLKADGILELNRQLPLPVPLLRIAVISAEGAAGYGDFLNQLHANPQRLRFTTRLFPAVMQGERVPPTVIAALDEIAADLDSWDCVVIIRGGGATSDLMGFENYDLASHVAQFPLPVVVGIGHERDITILDYVACIRVKTPTAAAEWLLAQGKQCVERLDRLGQAVARAVTERISGCKEQLGLIEGRLPQLPGVAVTRARSRLDRCAMALQSLSAVRISAQKGRLEGIRGALGVHVASIISRRREKLDALRNLIDALSPEATLRRGYSITRCDGVTVTDPAQIPPGAIITTTLAKGTITSKTELK